MEAGDARTDEQLVEAANAGEAAAFDALYFRYREWVLRIAWRFTGDREEALDVLQETFLYFLGKFPGFRLRARLTTFLYPAVRSVAVARGRKRRRRREVGLEAAGEAVGAEPPAAGEGGEVLAVLVQALSAAQREVVLMRFVDEMSLAEIAVALGVPVGTVKSRLHGAVERLRGDARLLEYFAG